jgi:hypothetical protein
MKVPERDAYGVFQPLLMVLWATTGDEIGRPST